MEEENQTVVRELWQLRSKYSNLEKSYNELVLENLKIKKERDDYKELNDKLTNNHNNKEKSLNLQINPKLLDSLKEEKENLSKENKNLIDQLNKLQIQFQDLTKQNETTKTECTRLKLIERKSWNLTEINVKLSKDIESYKKMNEEYKRAALTIPNNINNAKALIHQESNV